MEGDGVKMDSRRKLEYFDGTLFTNKIEYYMKSKGIKGNKKKI